MRSQEDVAALVVGIMFGLSGFTIIVLAVGYTLYRFCLKVKGETQGEVMHHYIHVHDGPPLFDVEDDEVFVRPAAANHIVKTDTAEYAKQVTIPEAKVV